MLPSFSLYGQDGYHLWMPVISEYLRGNETYHASSVIFDGQNLGAVYGELPFWPLLRWAGADPISLLNFTHGVWAALFMLLILPVLRGSSDGKSAAVLCALYACLCPIAANRLTAGHLNLLFGVLPFFALLSLMFDKSPRSLALAVLAFWCALSTQAYQILAYHVFYLPLLYVLVREHETRPGRYLLLAALTLGAAFLLNFPQFLDMLHHATNPDNQRPLDQGIVYSYLTSSWADFPLFLVSEKLDPLLGRGQFFYHELNYPVGLFAVIACLPVMGKRVRLAFFLSFALLWMFCMDLPPFNLVAELPLLKAFRVPQRSFMVLALFLPLYVYVRSGTTFRPQHLAALAGLTVLAQFISYYEVLVITGALLCWWKLGLPRAQAPILCLAFSGLFAGSVAKVCPPAREVHSDFLITQRLLAPLAQRYSAGELRQRSFHFETGRETLVNAVAQSMGIRTLEGYGHPPARLVRTFSDVLSVAIPPTNSLYFPAGLPHPQAALRRLGVRTIVTFGAGGKLRVQDL